jgi:hypothetical protein
MLSIALAHAPKSCGTYVSKYLASFLPSMGYTLCDYKDSRDKSGPKFPFCNSLAKIEKFPDENCFFNTHILTPANYQFIYSKYTKGVGQKLFRSLKQRNWFVFCFLREPKDQLTSAYFYHKEVRKDRWAQNITLEQFIQRCDYCCMELPGYWRQFDFVAEFTNDNFAYFLDKYLHHTYDPTLEIARNPSSNKGFDHYVSIGEISVSTRDKVLKHPCNRTFNQIREKLHESHKTIDQGKSIKCL